MIHFVYSAAGLKSCIALLQKGDLVIMAGEGLGESAIRSVAEILGDENVIDLPESDPAYIAERFTKGEIVRPWY